MNEIIPLLVVVPLAAAALANLAHKRHSILKLLAVVVPLILVSLVLLVGEGNHKFGVSEYFASPYTMYIVYMTESYSILLLGILYLIAFLVLLAYLGVYERLSGPYLGFFMLGIAATSAVLMARDLFNMYVFLEVALLSQTALVLATGTLRSLKAAIKYLIVANIAGNIFLLGVALLLSLFGTLWLERIQSEISGQGSEILSNPVYLLASACMVFYWMYVSGIFPFHNIKSELYSSAAVHASAIMQTQTKFLLIAVALLLLKIFAIHPMLRYIMLLASLFAMVFGVILALKQDDYHSMLSYHAISQAGYVAVGLSIGTPYAITAGIFHALNNALYKSALFLGCECIKIQRGSTKFSKLGASMYSLPLIAILVLFAKFAISGIPPFNGFQSKLMLVIASISAGMPEIALVMVLVSVLTFISMMKAFYLAFLGPYEGVENVDHSRLGKHLIALVILVGLCLFLGLFPEIVIKYISAIAFNVGSDWR